MSFQLRRYSLSIAQQLIRFVFSLSIALLLISGLLFFNKDNRHFNYLADAFVHGVFSVNDLPSNYVDKIVLNGNTYIPLGPMPGILLMPFVSVFGVEFSEALLVYPFTALSVLCLLVLFKYLKIPSHLHLPLLVSFFCGSVYLTSMAIGRSWFLSHVFIVSFVLLAITETLVWRRAWLVGVWLGIGFLTRSPVIVALPIFVWMLKPPETAWRNWRWWFGYVSQMLLGLAPFLIFYGYYNLVRFGNPLETGYAQASLASPTLFAARSQGLFSLAHIPKNLYALLLAPPQPYPSIAAPVLEFPYLYPSPWGMGILFTSPAFIYMFMANWRDRLVRAAWLAIGLIAVPLLTYYGIGWIQFGYRYALDFYPFLFILVALGLARRFDWKAKVLIMLGVAINIWGVWWYLIGFGTFPPELMR